MKLYSRALRRHCPWCRLSDISRFCWNPFHARVAQIHAGRLLTPLLTWRRRMNIKRDGSQREAEAINLVPFSSFLSILRGRFISKGFLRLINIEKKEKSCVGPENFGGQTSGRRALRLPCGGTSCWWVRFEWDRGMLTYSSVFGGAWVLG